MGNYSPPNSLHSYYYDFAYEDKGPFRMANGCIGDTNAKSFAQSAVTSALHFFA